MPTIKERLAELDEKIMAAKDQSEVAVECQEQYWIRYGTTLGKAFRTAEANRAEVNSKLLNAKYELDKQQRVVDVLASQLETADFIFNTVAGQEVPQKP